MNATALLEISGYIFTIYYSPTATTKSTAEEHVEEIHWTVES